jgi:hypothetical protein
MEFVHAPAKRGFSGVVTVGVVSGGKSLNVRAGGVGCTCPSAGDSCS